jgi:hypothetical protein
MNLSLRVSHGSTKGGFGEIGLGERIGGYAGKPCRVVGFEQLLTVHSDGISHFSEFLLELINTDVMRRNPPQCTLDPLCSLMVTWRRFQAWRPFD